MLLKQVHIARILLAVLLFSQTGLAVNVMYCGESIDKITALPHVVLNSLEAILHLDQRAREQARSLCAVAV